MMIRKKLPDVKLLTNDELRKEKNQLMKALAKIEKNYCQDNVQTDPSPIRSYCFSPNDALSYHWDIERLILVINEIFRRIEDQRWIFEFLNWR